MKQFLGRTRMLEVLAFVVIYLVVVNVVLPKLGFRGG
jgi:hypothetical protein